MKKLLISLILFMSYISVAYAEFEVEWHRKPVQCAETMLILDEVEKSKMLPLLQLLGTTRIGDVGKIVPYVIYYNKDDETWLMVEFLEIEFACMIALGQGINFNVGDNLERDTF